MTFKGPSQLKLFYDCMIFMFHVCAIFINPLTSIYLQREKLLTSPEKIANLFSDTAFQTISYQSEITTNLCLPLKDNLTETSHIHRQTL